jgi:site-specific DNA recombinase
MNRCAVYTRVSTDEQDTSIDNQQSYFIDYIQKHQWTLHEIYSDLAISGTETNKRHSFQRLLSDAKQKKFDILLAKSYSRFGRNQRVSLNAIADLISNNIRIIFIEDNIDTQKDMNFIGLWSWLAEQESRKVSERIKLIWKHYNEKGKLHTCTPAYGYDYDESIKNYIINPDEANIVKRIYSMYINGNGLNKIANILREDCIKTKKGGVWASATIKSILSNEVYIGNLIQGKSKSIDVTIKNRKKIPKSDWNKHENSHDAIIDINTFHQVQKLLTERSNNHGHNKHSNVALFSNIIFCGVCESAFTIKRQKHFKNYSPYYSCISYELKGKTFAGHSRLVIYENELKNIIFEYIKELKQNNYEKLKEILNENNKKSKEDKSLEQELKNVEMQLADNIKLTNTLLISLSKEMIDENQFKMQNDFIKKEFNQLTLRKEELFSQIKTIKTTKVDEYYLQKAIDELLNTNNWNNVMIKNAISKIILNIDGSLLIKLKISQS